MESKDKALKRIVTGFTKGILDGQTSKSKCFMVCAPLVQYLNMLSYKAVLTEGLLNISGDMYHHFWIEIGKMVIDPTADQFNEISGKNMPQIYIGTKPDWYLATTKDCDSKARLKSAVNKFNFYKIESKSLPTDKTAVGQGSLKNPGALDSPRQSFKTQNKQPCQLLKRLSDNS